MSTQIAYALVNADGSFTGTGIQSVEKAGKGGYNILFDTTYSSVPGATVSPWGADILASIGIWAENTIGVAITDLDGNGVDGGFSVVIVHNSDS